MPRPPGLLELLERRQAGEDVDPGERERTVADAVGDPSRVVAAPDCGFDAGAGPGMVHPEIAWAKPEAMGDGAARATDRLFQGFFGPPRVAPVHRCPTSQRPSTDSSTSRPRCTTASSTSPSPRSTR